MALHIGLLLPCLQSLPAPSSLCSAAGRRGLCRPRGPLSPPPFEKSQEMNRRPDACPVGGVAVIELCSQAVGQDAQKASRAAGGSVGLRSWGGGFLGRGGGRPLALLQSAQMHGGLQPQIFPGETDDPNQMITLASQNDGFLSKVLSKQEIFFGPGNPSLDHPTSS